MPRSTPAADTEVLTCLTVRAWPTVSRNTSPLNASRKTPRGSPNWRGVNSHAPSMLSGLTSMRLLCALHEDSQARRPIDLAVSHSPLTDTETHDSMSYFRELLSTRELLYNLVAREVKGQYRRTVLGQLWSLINPIATMIVYSIVFGFIFRAGPPKGDPSGLDLYPLWLMSGLLAWTFFARVMNFGLDSLVANANLIQKVYFPRMHLVLATMLSTAVTWCFELGVLIVALHLFGGFPLPWLPLLLVYMVLLALFATGVSM